MVKIIGIIGKKRCGKDHVSSLINEEYFVRRVAFADKLKEVVNIIYGVPLDFMHGDDKDTILFNPTTRQIVYDEAEMSELKVVKLNGVECLGDLDHDAFVTLRDLIVFVGTNVFQEKLGKNIFISAIELKDGVINLVKDIRFHPEYRFVKKFMGSKVIRIVNRRLDSNDDSVAETEMDSISSDYVIYNDYAPGDEDNTESLKEQIRVIMGKIEEGFK